MPVPADVRLFPRRALDRAEAEKMLRAWNSEIRVTELIPMRGGMSTSNDEARTNQGNFLLKVYRDLTGGIEPEMYAHLGALAPRLYYVDRSGRVCPRAYAVIEFVEGETLSEFILRRGRFPEALAEQIGGMLARVHARRYDREGLLDGQFGIVSPIPGARDRMLALAHGIAGNHLSPGTRDALIALCEEKPDLFARLDGDSVLCHGDAGFGNMLIAGDRAYFIDFEYALAGSRYRDIGHFFREKDAPVQASITDGVIRAFAAGYGGLPADWLSLARLADVPAMLALINRPDAPADWIRDIDRDARRAAEGLA